MSTVKAQLNRLRISPVKVRLVADVVRGMDVTDALAQLDVMEKRSAEPMAKLLRSAIANAVHNYGYSEENLRVGSVQVGEGVTMKRWLPRAHGRATKLLKRTSRVTIEIEEVKEGKNRIAPVQEKKMQDAMKDLNDKKDKSFSEDETSLSTGNKNTTIDNSRNLKNSVKESSGTSQRMFRRKSV